MGTVSRHAPLPMEILGKRHSLLIMREAPPGFYLDGLSYGEILLPGRYMPSHLIPGDMIDVFIYRDSEDRLVATTETPLAMIGDFAYLRVVGVRPSVGAFLDWGLEKDLLLPRREQGGFLNVGDWVVVHVCLDDKSDRIIATTRLHRWTSKPPAFAKDHPVKLLVSGETPLGYNAIVENAYRGLLYSSDLAGPLRVGDELNGFVRAVRPDGKLDLALDRTGLARIGPLTQQILDKLKSNGGRLPLHDGSSPEEIREAFGVSKKAFKQAVGALYRKRQIQIANGEIRAAK